MRLKEHYVSSGPSLEMTGISHFLFGSQSSRKTFSPPDTTIAVGKATLGHTEGDSCPAVPRGPCHPAEVTAVSAEATFIDLRQQENHPAEPRSDVESRHIITGCSKPLSFRVVCYTATENWNIFTYAFLQNSCSPEREEDSSRFFGVQCNLVPLQAFIWDISQTGLLTVSQHVCPTYSSLCDFTHFNQPCLKAQNCTAPSSVEPPVGWNFPLLKV